MHVHNKEYALQATAQPGRRAKKGAMTYKGSVRLGDLFDSRREKGKPGLPLLSVTMNDGLVDREDLGRKQETNLAPDEHLLVKAGDIAYNMMRMWQGAFGVCKRDGLVSPAYVVLRALGAIDTDYAAYLFDTPRLKYLFWAYSYGLTDDRLRLYYPDFSRIAVDLPTKKKQREVVAALALWDRAIEVQKKALDNCEREKRLERVRLMSLVKRHDVTATVAPLGELATFVSGGTPAKDRADYWGGAFPWITVKDMKHFHVSETELKISNQARSKVRAVPEGTTLVLIRGMTLLHRLPVVVTSQESSFNQDIKGLLPKKGLLGEFLAHALLAQEERILGLVETAGHGTGRLDTEVLKQVSVTVPSLRFQRSYIGALSSFEGIRTNHRRQLNALKREKQALLRRLICV